MHSRSASFDPAIARRWASTIAGEIILPGDREYDESRQVWNRAIDRRPAAIVVCAGVDDVRRTLELARTLDLPVAIRGGGHSQAGHGVADDAVVIDLGQIRDVHLNLMAQTVRAAGGARVSDIIDAIRPRGVITPTGGCPDVGVGGLTLGGGENMVMARVGATCDNVLAATVVTADGAVLTASEDEHPNLFWALRGGSGNFGIVLGFEFRVFPIARVLSGLMYFPVSRTADVIRRYRDLMTSVGDELQTSGGLMPTAHGPMLMISFCHCGEIAAGEQMAARWRESLKPTTDTIAPGPYPADFSMGDGPSVGTGAFLPELSDEAVTIFDSFFAGAPRNASAVWNDFHGAVTRVPVDAMAFPLRARGFDLFISVGWEHGKEKAAATAWVAGLGGALRPHSRGVYVNNLERDETSRVREAYGDNYARLTAIKARYDPDNVFHVNANIAPGLEDV